MCEIGKNLERENHYKHVSPEKIKYTHPLTLYPQSKIFSPNTLSLSLSKKNYFLSLQIYFSLSLSLPLSLAHHRHRRRLIQTKQKKKTPNFLFKSNR